MTQKENTHSRECSIPDPMLAKLYDYTGTRSGANKGFILFFPNEEGQPYCISRTDNTMTKIALTEVVKMYAKSDGELFEGEGDDFEYNDFIDPDDQ